jgi:hypothetical protein
VGRYFVEDSCDRVGIVEIFFGPNLEPASCNVHAVTSKDERNVYGRDSSDRPGGRYMQGSGSGIMRCYDIVRAASCDEAYSRTHVRSIF